VLVKVLGADGKIEFVFLKRNQERSSRDNLGRRVGDDWASEKNACDGEKESDLQWDKYRNVVGFV